MGNLKTFKTLVKENKAPRGAKYIGVFKKVDGGEDQLVKKINITHTNLENTKTDTPLYSFGVLSDIHISDNNTTYKETRTEAQVDFANAISFFQDDLIGAKFVCACGDLGIGNNKGVYWDEYLENADWERVGEILSTDSARTIPFFTAMGNHDTTDFAYKDDSDSRDDNTIEYVKGWINGEKNNIGQTFDGWYNFTFKSNGDRIKNKNINEIYFQGWPKTVNGKKQSEDVLVWSANAYQNDAVWDTDKNGYEDEDTVKTGSFYFKYGDDVFIFFSLHYGIYFENFVDDINREYPNIEWLCNVLENNKDKRCFVFMHPPFLKKAGNLYGKTGKGERDGSKIYQDGNYVLTRSSWETGDTFDALNSRQHNRLNTLNNRYKNSIWFYGHTHFKWHYQKYFKRAHITTTDPDIVQSGVETESAVNIGMPSCAYPRNIVDVDFNGYNLGSAKNYYDDWDDSEGLLVKVYEHRVELIGVKFKNGDDNDTSDNVYPSGTTESKVPDTSVLYQNLYQPMNFYSIDTTKKEIQHATQEDILSGSYVLQNDYVIVRTNDQDPDDAKKIAIDKNLFNVLKGSYPEINYDWDNATIKVTYSEDNVSYDSANRMRRNGVNYNSLNGWVNISPSDFNPKSDKISRIARDRATNKSLKVIVLTLPER